MGFHGLVKVHLPIKSHLRKSQNLELNVRKIYLHHACIFQSSASRYYPELSPAGHP